MHGATPPLCTLVLTSYSEQCMRRMPLEEVREAYVLGGSLHFVTEKDRHPKCVSSCEIVAMVISGSKI